MSFSNGFSEYSIENGWKNYYFIPPYDTPYAYNSLPPLYNNHDEYGPPVPQGLFPEGDVAIDPSNQQRCNVIFGNYAYNSEFPTNVNPFTEQVPQNFRKEKEPSIQRKRKFHKIQNDTGFKKPKTNPENNYLFDISRINFEQISLEQEYLLKKEAISDDSKKIQYLKNAMNQILNRYIPLKDYKTSTIVRKEIKKYYIRMILALFDDELGTTTLAEKEFKKIKHIFYSRNARNRNKDIIKNLANKVKNLERENFNLRLEIEKLKKKLKSKQMILINE